LINAPVINNGKTSILFFIMWLMANSLGINPRKGGIPPRDNRLIVNIFLEFFL